jgi:hypothetical protein
MKRLVIPALCAAALSACASTPTTFQPAIGPQAVGYSEYRIEPGRYRITFRGGPGAPPGLVTDYALLRAADLAIADGYDWFRVSDRFLEGRPDRSPRFSLGVGGGGGSYGYRGGSSVGVGLGTSFPLGGGPVVAATVEVLMGRGPRPQGADVYDPRGLRQTMMGRGI